MSPITGEALLERDRELRLLSEGLDRARAGAGSLFLIEGAPGIGKTALLAAVRSRAAATGIVPLAARAGELEQEFPFGVARQLLERAIRRELSGAEPVSLMDGPAARTRALFGTGDKFAALGDDARAQAMLYGLYWLVANVSERGPVAIVVDDAHWSDIASLRLLDVLARRVEELPITIVVAHRPAPADPQSAVIERLRASPGAVRMSLSPLSDTGSAAILARALGHQPGPRFVAVTQSLTGGNPFLTEELALEAGDQEIRGEDAEASRIASIIPSSVEDSIRARLATAGEGGRALAEALAILGDGTPLRIAARVAGITTDAAQRDADRLDAVHLLRGTRPPGFRHPLLRTAVLEGIAPGRRGALHRRAARVLADEGADPARIAGQLLGTEPSGDLATATVLRTAAHDATAKGDPETAATFLRRALDELAGADPRRGGVQLELGTTLTAVEPAAAAEVLVDLAKRSSDAALRASAGRAAAHALCTIGRVREARDFAEAELELLQDSDEPAVRDLARVAAELNVTAADKPKLAISATRRYWRWAEGHTDEAPIADAQRAYMLAAAGRDRDQARDLALGAADARAAWDRLGPDEYSFAALIIVLLATDDLAEAGALATRGLERGREEGHLTAVANSSMWRSLVALQAGDLISAEVDALAALTIAGETEQSVGVPIATATLAGSLIEQGRLASAVEILETPSLGLDRLVEDNRQATMTLIVRGTARLLAGRTDEAVADLDRVARLSSALGDRNPAFGGEWRAAQIPALLAADRIAEAGERADENLTLARAWGAARSVGIALRTCALTELNRGHRLAHLEEAVATLQHSPARLEHARALVSLGSELRRQGKRTQAREPLRQGLDLAAERGAQGLADFARAELVAAGARPRRERTAGPDALTASERRVAELAASGLSNREIAQTLFVTIKAVGYHLTNCYRKLDIQGREQLTAALNQPAPRS